MPLMESSRSQKHRSWMLERCPRPRGWNLPRSHRSHSRRLLPLRRRFPLHQRSRRSGEMCHDQFRSQQEQELRLLYKDQIGRSSPLFPSMTRSSRFRTDKQCRLRRHNDFPSNTK